MRINKKGLDLIKKYEGFRSKPYLCPANVATIGYGATYYPYGEDVTLSDAPITKEEGEKLLKVMMDKYEEGVERYVTSDINANQFSALVSFAYNCGLGSLKKSTLLRRVNSNPNNPDISKQFARWKHANGVVLKGLERRRKEEAELYFSL